MCGFPSLPVKCAVYAKLVLVEKEVVYVKRASAEDAQTICDGIKGPLESFVVKKPGGRDIIIFCNGVVIR